MNPNSVKIERAGNRIFLASQVPTPGLKYSIPGASWSVRRGYWSLPLDLTTCHMLRERFGQRLVIGPALREWAAAEKAKRSTLDALTVDADAKLKRLPEVAPTLFAATSSRKYQRAGIRFITEAQGRDGRLRALLADTVGLGKSVQAIGAILENGQPGPYLITCPKTAVESTWVKEIRNWLGDDADIIILPEGRVKRDNILNSLLSRSDLQNTWVIVHPEAVRTQTWWICQSVETDVAGNKIQCGFKTKYRAGRIDELDCGHLKEHRGTKQTLVEHEHAFPQLFLISEWGAVVADESDQSLIRLTGKPNLRRRGMEMLRDNVRPGGIRLAMSGTPLRSKAHQIWSTLNWLDPVAWSSKWNFIGKYWTLGGYSGYTIGDFKEGMEDLLIDELRGVMCRRERADVRSDLPPKDYPSNVNADSGLTPGIYLTMTKLQEHAYRAIEKNGSAQIEGGTLNPIGVLAELTRLKQFAGASGRINSRGEFEPQAAGNKYEWILEFLEELGFPDKPSNKLVIASQFTQLLEAFSAGVDKAYRGNLKSARLTGNVAGNKRPGIISAFEDYDSGLDLLWLNTKAGGSSITLDAADIMIVLDETWVSDEQEQLEGRIDNRQPERKIGPRSYYYLRSAGTIEEGIARANADAKARGEQVLNGAAIARRAQEGNL